MGTSKYSNEFKALCIDNGDLEIVQSFKKRIYKDNDGALLIHWLDCLSRDNYLDCSNRLLESKYRKYSRARKHIGEIVKSSNAVFITLTFTDDILKKTNATTRRKYVARYLKEQSDNYVANIDYSPEKEREHYHAIVSNRIDISKWEYGFVWCEQVRTHDHNCDRVSRYITKLTSHAFKVNSTRLIYSRNVL